MLTVRCLVAALLLCQVGCGSSIHLEDDVDLALDFSPFAAQHGQLQLPSVQGTQVRIYARSSEPRDVSGWWLRSSDRTVR